MRTCVVLLLSVALLGFDRTQAWIDESQARSAPLDRPANIVVESHLTNVVAEAIRGSRTFREQCRELGRVERLRITVVVDAHPAEADTRNRDAQCVIRRYQFGRIEARVDVWAADRAAQLIGHELEHVREYLDGVKYRLLAIRSPREAWVTLSGHYETARAIEVGDRIAREMTRYRMQQQSATLAPGVP